MEQEVHELGGISPVASTCVLNIAHVLSCATPSAANVTRHGHGAMGAKISEGSVDTAFDLDPQTWAAHLLSCHLSVLALGFTT